ncbi:MAG TPA: helix-turn-helix transcriptional regulator [Ignavibacteriales bacterium]|nr:helix-turn-helix transcriptional regulator [Ignavibacteriales bacterium]
MNKELEKHTAEYKRILDMQVFDESELDYSILEKHIPFLEKLDVIDSSSIAIFDLYKREHIYLSSKFESVHGYNLEEAYKEGNEYFDSRVHPDDMIDRLRAGNYFLKMAYDIGPVKMMDYKLLTEYRMLSRNGYIRVVEQFKALETDKRGNIWLAFCLMDIAPVNDITSPAKFRLINYRTGDLYYFPPIEEKPDLSTREQEVLKLISQGLISKQIADSLYISVHTVNTHRQRIIEKLNVSNTAEAVKFAYDIGLL